VTEDGAMREDVIDDDGGGEINSTRIVGRYDNQKDP
jgi:hypothetical protein